MVGQTSKYTQNDLGDINVQILYQRYSEPFKTNKTHHKE